MALACYENGKDTDQFREDLMADLTPEQTKAMGVAAGLDITDEDLIEVTHSLNAILETLAEVNPEGLENIEPLPIHLPANPQAPA